MGCISIMIIITISCKVLLMNFYYYFLSDALNLGPHLLLGLTFCILAYNLKPHSLLILWLASTVTTYSYVQQANYWSSKFHFNSLYPVKIVPTDVRSNMYYHVRPSVSSPFGFFVKTNHRNCPSSQPIETNVLHI